MAIDAEDIKQWGKDNGWEVEEGKRLPSGLRAAYDARNNGGPALFPTDSDTSTEEAYIDPSTGQFVPGVEPLGEIAPVIKGPTLGDRLKAGAARVRKAGPAKPRRQSARKPRVSVDKVIAGGWRALARIVQLAGPTMAPVSRVLVLQSPVIGLLLEDAVKNTAIDRALQPLARAQNGSDLAFALIGPPLATAAIVQRPDMYPVLRPVLRYSLMSWIRVAGPKLEVIAEEEADFEERYGKRVDEMLDAIFASETEENG